jgi:murein L,D-transpeptidase YcbB/YkuD
MMTMLISSCSSIKNYEDYHPNTQRIANTIPQYQKISRQPWPKIASSHVIKPNKKAPQISLIRDRLLLLGDLAPYNVEKTNLYDQSLKKAVMKFQSRHGLKPDGVIGKTTLEALNVPPQQRLSQLQTSLSQWMALPPVSDKPYIQVNLASYDLDVINNNQSDLTMKVVVGSKHWPTPKLSSHIQSIVINPKWTIPRNIVEKEIVHKIAEDPNYLNTEKIAIYKDWQYKELVDAETIDWHDYTGDKDLPYRLRQSAGDHNALGRLKFTFPNSQHIYLHDTPYKQAFDLPKRNLSHGCVRLEKPHALLEYLLTRKQIKNAKRLDAFKATDKTQHFALKEKLPLYITEITAWVDKKGLVHFR